MILKKIKRETILEGLILEKTKWRFQRMNGGGKGERTRSDFSDGKVGK